LKRLPAGGSGAIVVSSALPVLVAASLALKGLFLARILARPRLAVGFGDPLSYYEVARDLLVHGSFESTIRPILFPLVYAGFIAIFRSAAPVALVVVQYAVSILAGLALYAVVRRKTSSESRALLAFSLYSLNPILTLYESSTFSDPLFLALCTFGISLYLLDRLTPAALCFSAAALVRPVGLPLFGLLLLFDWVKGTRRREVLVAAAVLAVLVGPWILRYRVKYGQLSLSNIGDFNIGLYQASMVYAEARGLPMTEARKEWTRRIYQEGGFEGRYPPPDPRLLDETAAFWPYRNYPEITRFALGRALELYAEHPLISLKYVATGMVLSALNPASEPISVFFGLKPSEVRRTRVVDSLLRLDWEGLRASGALTYVNRASPLSLVYLLMNIAAFALLARNVARREADPALVGLFLANWFVAGFAGVGSARHFTGGYAFLVLAALLTRREAAGEPERERGVDAVVRPGAPAAVDGP
jgi:hypothetical protein